MQRAFTIQQIKTNNFRKLHGMPMLRGKTKARYRDIPDLGWRWEPNPDYIVAYKDCVNEFMGYRPVGPVPDSVEFMWQWVPYTNPCLYGLQYQSVTPIPSSTWEHGAGYVFPY